MDLQTAKSQYGAHWAWARTGALILFLLAGVLLAASLSTLRTASAGSGTHPRVSSITSILPFGFAG